MQNFLSQVKQTSYDELRPRYVVLIEESDNDKKILSQKFYSEHNWNFELHEIERCIYYTYCSANLHNVTRVLKKRLGHSNFIVTEIGIAPDQV